MEDKLCVVVLVSTQTVPNVLFLKWILKKNPTSCFDLFFISTNAMEKNQKSNAIWNALEDNHKSFLRQETILVSENDMADVQKEIGQMADFTSYKKIDVSITGGTKLMSIASYQFFCKFKNAQIFYQPISDSLQELYPNQDIFSDVENLTLSEYFNAFNLKFSFSNNCVKDWNYNKNVLSKIESCAEGRKYLFDIQNEKHFKRRLDEKKILDLTDLNQDYLGKLFPSINLQKVTDTILETVKLFDFNPKNIRRDEFRYITGGWFEEFVFQKTMEEQHLKAGKSIALNVTIESPNKTNNELDVVYVDEKNTLHIIECKSFIDQKSQGELLNNTIYKVQALKAKFGLTVKSHLYTMSVIDKDSVLNRTTDFGISIFDRSKLCPELSVF